MARESSPSVGQRQDIAATSDLVRRLAEVEHELQEGPCVQAELDHRTYRIDDMAHDTRWPRFAAAAAEVGIHSMLGYRLFISGRTLGGHPVRRARRDRDDRAFDLLVMTSWLVDQMNEAAR